MSIGKLSKVFGTRGGMAILITQLLLVLVLSYFYTGYHSSQKCASCHSDKGRMTKLGYPEFAMTVEQVQRESRHPNTDCRDCHLGNGLSDNPAKAHKGMLKLIVLDNDHNVIPRKDQVSQLIPSGEDRLRKMLPRNRDGSINYEVGTIMYQDRNLNTLGYDPSIAQKTCGKSSCHPDQVDQFSTSIMGSNYRQRSMRTWNDIHGPNN